MYILVFDLLVEALECNHLFQLQVRWSRRIYIPLKQWMWHTPVSDCEEQMDRFAQKDVLGDVFDYRADNYSLIFHHRYNVEE